jgi:uncharacterized phage protein (TIGR02218 family)
MLELAPPLKSLITNKVHRFATLWQIDRTDGVTLRFTDHDSVLLFDSQQFLPAGGVSPSARQRNEQLKDRNLEAMGALTSDAITFDDLRAGRYRQAQVTERLVDWRYPWADAFYQCRYYIVSTTFNGDVWTASLEGLTHRLKMVHGRIYGRTCDVAQFGDDRCDPEAVGRLAANTFPGSITSINTPRRDFGTDVTGRPANWFKSGTVYFTSGNCNGLRMDVSKSYTSGRLVLWIDMPFNLQIGDTFNVVTGCDRLFGTCRTKFGNGPNFRGFPHIPGTDAAFKTPDSHIKN